MEQINQEKEKPVKTDWLAMIVFFAVLISACIVTYYLITEKINSCSANPLKYQADKLAKEGNFNYSYAWIGIYEDKYSINALSVKELNLRQSSMMPLSK